MNRLPDQSVIQLPNGQKAQTPAMTSGRRALTNTKVQFAGFDPVAIIPATDWFNKRNALRSPTKVNHVAIRNCLGSCCARREYEFAFLVRCIFRSS